MYHAKHSNVNEMCQQENIFVCVCVRINVRKKVVIDHIEKETRTHTKKESSLIRWSGDKTKDFKSFGFVNRAKYLRKMSNIQVLLGFRVSF